MSLYGRCVLPHLIDLAMKDRPIGRQRRKIVPEARGRVLEIGVGSGKNFPFYDAEQVSELIALEPSAELVAMAKRAAEGLAVAKNLSFLSAASEEIPLDDDSVDTVVITYTLCSVVGVEQALGEVKRVLKKSGRLLFSEHGLSPDRWVRKWQATLNPLWKRIAGGCHLNRNIPLLLEQAGFRVEDLEELYLPGPRPLRYNYLGRCRIRSS